MAASSPGVVFDIGISGFTATINSLASGQVLTVIYPATAPSSAGSLVRNTAVVTAAGDPDSGNNAPPSGEVQTPVINQVDLALQKTPSGNRATAGVAFTYTLAITNRGPDTAFGVVVTDSLTGGASYHALVAATNLASVTHEFGVSSATFTVTSIAPNTVFTIVYTVLPPVNGGVFTNTAGVTGTASSEQDPGDNFSPPLPVVGQASADLEIEKTAQPSSTVAGGVITYMVVVTNRGLSAAVGVTVTDVVSGATVSGVVGATPGVGSTFSGNVLTFTIGTLNAGEAVTMMYTVTAPIAGGVVSNSAVVTSTVADPNPSNNVPPGGGVSTPIEGRAVLTVTKAQTYTQGIGGRIRFGGLVTYTVTVTNTSVTTATNAALTDTLSRTHLKNSAVTES